MLILVLRTLIVYVAVTACVRLMGKRQVGELQSSELVITLLVSELATVPLQGQGVPLSEGIVPMLTLVVCELLVSGAMLKSRALRRLLCGRPVTVIQNGCPQVAQMRRLRITVEDLTEQLRLQGVFDLNEVAFAAVEPNGQLSVQKKAEYDPPDAQTLGVKADRAFFAVVVCDGAFCPHSAQLCGRTRAWTEQVLKKEKCAMRDVFLLTADAKGAYRLVRKKDEAKGEKALCEKRR